MPLNEIAQPNVLGQGYQDGIGVYPLLLDASGAQVVIDFFFKAILDGKGFQVRAGTLTTPLIGDVVITDTAAEYCIDPPAGATAIPVAQFISIRLATGTLHEYASKSVASASSAGTAFVCLPLLPGASACGTTARVSAAGGVTVTAELATTTRRHWSWANPAAGFTGALPGDQHQEWHPLRPPPIKSTVAAPFCFYTQIAATSTGPSYYASLDFLEFASALLGT